MAVPPHRSVNASGRHRGIRTIDLFRVNSLCELALRRTRSHRAGDKSRLFMAEGNDCCTELASVGQRCPGLHAPVTSQSVSQLPAAKTGSKKGFLACPDHPLPVFPAKAFLGLRRGRVSGERQFWEFSSDADDECNEIFASPTSSQAHSCPELGVVQPAGLRGVAHAGKKQNRHQCKRAEE